jgi:hypothetical protein
MSLYGQLYKQSFIHWHYPNTRVVGLCQLLLFFLCAALWRIVLYKKLQRHVNPSSAQFYYGKNVHILIIKNEQK